MWGSNEHPNESNSLILIQQTGRRTAKKKTETTEHTNCCSELSFFLCVPLCVSVCRCNWEWRYADNPINHVLWMRRVACSEHSNKVKSQFLFERFFPLIWPSREKKNIALNFIRLLSKNRTKERKKRSAMQRSWVNTIFSLELIFLWCLIVNRQEYGYKAFEALNCESGKFHFIQYSKRFQKEVRSYEREDARLFFFEIVNGMKNATKWKCCRFIRRRKEEEEGKN